MGTKSGGPRARQRPDETPRQNIVPASRWRRARRGPRAAAWSLLLAAGAGGGEAAGHHSRLSRTLHIEATGGRIDLLLRFDVPPRFAEKWRWLADRNRDGQLDDTEHEALKRVVFARAVEGLAIEWREHGRAFAFGRSKLALSPRPAGPSPAPPASRRSDAAGGGQQDAPKAPAVTRSHPDDSEAPAPAPAPGGAGGGDSSAPAPGRTGQSGTSAPPPRTRAPSAGKSAARARPASPSPRRERISDPSHPMTLLCHLAIEEDTPGTLSVTQSRGPATDLVAITDAHWRPAPGVGPARRRLRRGDAWQARRSKPSPPSVRPGRTDRPGRPPPKGR